MRKNGDGIDVAVQMKVGCCRSEVMQHGLQVLLLTLLVILVFLPCKVSAFWPFDKATKDTCVAKYQEEARCQAAMSIVNDVCKCKFDNTCRYPSRGAIECILSNIGEAENNTAAYLMRNSCLLKHPFAAQ